MIICSIISILIFPKEILVLGLILCFGLSSAFFNLYKINGENKEKNKNSEGNIVITYVLIFIILFMDINLILSFSPEATKYDNAEHLIEQSKVDSDIIFCRARESTGVNFDECMKEQAEFRQKGE